MLLPFHFPRYDLPTAGSLLVRTFSELLCNCKKGATCGCLSFVNFTDAAAIQHALDMYDEYFVFFFSRNVMSRAISQYQVSAAGLPELLPLLSEHSRPARMVRCYTKHVTFTGPNRARNGFQTLH